MFPSRRFQYSVKHLANLWTVFKLSISQSSLSIQRSRTCSRHSYIPEPVDVVEKPASKRRSTRFSPVPLWYIAYTRVSDCLNFASTPRKPTRLADYTMNFKSQRANCPQLEFVQECTWFSTTERAFSRSLFIAWASLSNSFDLRSKSFQITSTSACAHVRDRLRINNSITNYKWRMRTNGSSTYPAIPIRV